ncbi:MAG: bifunctional phosphoribosyl-AMP cyclohydrolase/phosphoribosyl-ATP diphosphatase HisIE [Bacteroidia bacterium]|nr:bifunctional phosphoribosyl-AMP cyclohydrolase/phosphoribosyl-ATP diphosphatase HisIE [Bacteroidia bacterium]
MREPDFSRGLLPAIIQDAATHGVLMLGYMNEEAYRRTQETGYVTLYSRRRQALWVKGETSGHYLKVVEIHIDCDGDSILVRAIPAGPTCHLGSYSCFAEDGDLLGSFLGHLWRIIEVRAAESSAASYTYRLLSAGVPRIAQKVGEEAVETLIAALSQSKERLSEEAADLLYHLWVLLYASGVQLSDVEAVLRRRHERRP